MNAKRTPLIPLIAALCTAGCAAWLWSKSNPVPKVPASVEKAPAVSGVPPQARVAVPEAPPERRKAALFDSDLGPESVDVSAYPADQRRNYAVYSRVCARCHTLARSINSPYVSRGWWEFYITNMRMRSGRRGESLDARDAATVLDFLEYDSNARKIARASEFDAVRFELKKRFEAVLEERVNEHLIESEPGS
jgi:hypothetical protein